MKSILAIVSAFIFSGASSAFAAEALTLEKSIEIGIRNATSVLQTGNQAELVGVRILRAYGQFLPNLTLNGNYAYQTGNTLVLIDGRSLVYARGPSAAYTVGSTLNLFNGLSDYSGLKSSLARKAATDYSLQWAKQQVALDISQTYLQVVLDQDLLDIAQKNLAASEARLKLLQGQSEVGSASVPDLYRQQAQTSSDSFAVTSNQAQLKNDEILLIRKLRIDPSQDYVFEAPPLGPTPSKLASSKLEEILKNTDDQRSDVKSNLSLLESNDWDVSQARSGYLPRLDLVFSRTAAGAYVSQEAVNGQNDLNFQQTGVFGQLGSQVDYSIGITLSWNIFDRFVTRYNVEQAKTTYLNTQIAVEDSRLQTQSDIRSSYNNYWSVQKEVMTAQVGLSAAQKSYDAIEGEYEVGSASIVDVLTAQAALVQARSNVAQSLTNLKLQEKTLQYAAGEILNESK